jgi:hypothetical protein
MTTHPIRIASLNQCERQVRETICPRCSQRSGQGCERSCPLFHALPTLLQAARKLDPMLANRPAIRSLIAQAAGGQPSNSPLRRHQRLLARLIEERVAI